MMPVTDDDLVLVTFSDRRAVAVPPLASSRSVLTPVIVVEVVVNKMLCNALPVVMLIGVMRRVLSCQPPMSELNIHFTAAGSFVGPWQFDVLSVDIVRVTQRQSPFDVVGNFVRLLRIRHSAEVYAAVGHGFA